MHQQNQNYGEPLTCTVVRIKYLFYWFVWNWNEYCGNKDATAKNAMGWFKFCLYIRAHKNQTSWNLWDPSLQRNLVPAKTFPGMSLAASGARDRTLQQHVAWSVMCQNGATRCQACAELFGYSLDPYVVHIPPRLQGNKRKKSWVKHNTFFACSKAVNNNKKSFFVTFLYL